ncbi:Protoheme IX farnesyltransferase, mitochondrial [Basidiobolus ranarum]|uniref:Heme O synthase n=1 Tax=Basidiobolus ranarum TaxID=34480 RepID=A0ABR2WA24_9FUNG
MSLYLGRFFVCSSRARMGFSRSIVKHVQYSTLKSRQSLTITLLERKNSIQGISGLRNVKRALPCLSEVRLVALHSTIPQEEENTPTIADKAGVRWKPVPELTLAKLPQIYKELSKAKLAALVALTTMCGYAVAPEAVNLTTMFWTTIGTTLCISSANSFNQWVEIPYDAQMSRTRNRTLVRHAASPLHAFAFGSVTGISGVSMLAFGVSPLVAALGAINIGLYAAVYTPLKRISIANTWVGAVVGGIPPMMGWAACTNGLEPGAWLLGFILYAWQFPHFNSLSWNLRADYSKAGFRMMAVTDPALNARVSLRYSLALLPLSCIAPMLDVTTWWFAADSFLVNAYLLHGAWRFWRHSDEQSARKLFFGSLVHLPLILALLMVHKKSKKEEQKKLPYADLKDAQIIRRELS